VEEILRASVNLVKYERNQVEVKWDISPRLPLVRGYKYRLIQVFSNLLSMRFRQLRGKGEVRIRAHSEPPSDAGSGGGKSSDNGPRHWPEHLSKDFQPFYSATGEAIPRGLRALHLQEQLWK
jgi:C4-dicarboxylate-specific signal transduction histidine kinase